MATRILIADDNEVARIHLRELLQNHDGWEVCAEVENGQQAVMRATELKPDFVILDLTMPVMDGLKAARQISQVLPSLPILVYTLHDASWLELEARKAGVQRVISKTDAPGTLLSAVEELLRKQPQETADGMALAATACGPLDVPSTVKGQSRLTE